MTPRAAEVEGQALGALDESRLAADLAGIVRVPAVRDAGPWGLARARGTLDACLIPEPTALRVVCAHGGALTFRGTLTGRAAHAGLRLEGVSAIDRYLPVHAALHELERELNADVANPLMARLPLPYPLLVGRLRAGRWSSQVPDRLTFEGRVGVPVGATPAEVRARWSVPAGSSASTASTSASRSPIWPGPRASSCARSPGSGRGERAAPNPAGLQGRAPARRRRGAWGDASRRHPAKALGAGSWGSRE